MQTGKGAGRVRGTAIGIARLEVKRTSGTCCCSSSEYVGIEDQLVLHTPEHVCREGGTESAQCRVTWGRRLGFYIGFNLVLTLSEIKIEPDMWTVAEMHYTSPANT